MVGRAGAGHGTVLGLRAFAVATRPPQGWLPEAVLEPDVFLSPTSLVGPMLIEFNIPVDLKLVEQQNPKVKLGGRYSPTTASPHKVAIIIPFRNRRNTKYWLYYLHPILQRQQLDYGIYVINQVRSGGMEGGREGGMYTRSCVCARAGTYVLNM